MYNSPGSEDVMCLVVDVGSLTTRVGFAGDDGPKQLWDSCAGQMVEDNNTIQLPPTSSSDLIFPLDFHKKREYCAVKPCLYVGENGQHRMNEEVFERIISHTCEGGVHGKGRGGNRRDELYSNGRATQYKNNGYRGENAHTINGYTNDEENHGVNARRVSEDSLEAYSYGENERERRRSLVCGLGAPLNEHPVLLSEPSKPSRPLRQSMTEIMFECFDVPAIYVAKRALLSTFAVGRSTGLVVDAGASLLSIAPVTDGYVRIPHVKEYSVSGNTLDMQFSHFLAEQQIPLYPTYGVTKTMKNNGKGFSVTPIDCTRVHPSYLQYSQYETVRNLKEAMCRVTENEADINNAQLEYTNTIKSPSVVSPFYSTQYNELPDGTQLEAEPYMYRVPEILFKPSLIKSSNENLLGDFKGLPVAVAQCINEYNAELRRDLLNALIFVGGTSKLPGLSERLGNTVSRLLSAKVRMVASSLSFDRRFSSWIGGSVLASITSFHNMWISQEEYNEHGPQVVDRKCG